MRVCVRVWQASGAEQRVKQLQEELKCHRQNAESSRLQHQQRVKDLEKQYQRVRWKQKKPLYYLFIHDILRKCVWQYRKVWLTFYCVCWLQDLMEFQKERQSLEKQHQHEMNKLNQELQHARTLHNALQAQVDKVHTVHA